MSPNKDTPQGEEEARVTTIGAVVEAKESRGSAERAEEEKGVEDPDRERAVATMKGDGPRGGRA